MGLCTRPKKAAEAKAVEEAKKAGKLTASHAQGATGIKNAIQAGVDSIEHGFFLDAEAIDMMLERETFLVPTLAGEETVKIKPGTQAGETIRLKGKGMPRFRGYGKGDLLVRVGISVPERLTAKQRELLEQLAEEFDQEVKHKKSRFSF